MKENKQNTITIDANILKKIKEYCLPRGLKIGKFIENTIMEHIKNNTNE